MIDRATSDPPRDDAADAADSVVRFDYLDPSVPDDPFWYEPGDETAFAAAQRAA